MKVKFLFAFVTGNNTLSKHLSRSTSLKSGALSDRLRKRRCFADEELDRTMPFPANFNSVTSNTSRLDYPVSLGAVGTDRTMALNNTLPHTVSRLTHILPHMTSGMRVPVQVNKETSSFNLNEEYLRKMYCGVNLSKFGLTWQAGKTNVGHLFQDQVRFVKGDSLLSGFGQCVPFAKTNLTTTVSTCTGIHSNKLEQRQEDIKKCANTEELLVNVNKEFDADTKIAPVSKRPVTKQHELKFSISSLLGLKE